MDEKTFVLDTSVLIHDPEAPKKFGANRVVIPLYVVMELDVLKSEAASRRYEVSAASRQVSRFLKRIVEAGDAYTTDVMLPEYETSFRIVGTDEDMAFFDHVDNNRIKMDRLIIQLAAKCVTDFPDTQVVLVSKDVNMQILASRAGVKAEDYQNDRVAVERDEMYKGYRAMRCGTFDLQIVLDSYHQGLLYAEEVGLTDLEDNEFVIFEHGDEDGKASCFRFHGDSGVLEPVLNREAYGIKHRNYEQKMALDVLLDPQINLVILVGKAGVGKTLIALAAALQQLGPGSVFRPTTIVPPVKGAANATPSTKKTKVAKPVAGAGVPEDAVTTYGKIVLAKPVIAMGKDIGYLPGDFSAKMAPWMMSFFDNLDQIMPGERPRSHTAQGLPDLAVTAYSGPQKNWEFLMSTGAIEIQALHSIRGRSIAESYIILDECQNVSPHEIKTVLSRAAKGTKVVIMGDPDQIDSQFLDARSNGLIYALDRLKGHPLVGVVTLTQGERSPLAEMAATLL